MTAIRWAGATTAVGVLMMAAALPAAIRAQTAPERFTLPSDGHPMAVWVRVPAAPRAAVLLVHGRTWSGRPDFDLQVPGLQRSVLASLSARGVAAYAIDLRGYGMTPRDATGWNTPRRSAADVNNVLAWIAERHPSVPKPALVGWSRGAAIAMLAAQMAPARVSALTLFGFAYDPEATFVDTPPDAKPARARNTADSARSDFISPRVTPPAVIRAFVAQALASDPVTADVRGDGEFNDLAPARLMTPTLVIFGDRDPAVVPREAAKFLERLGTTAREMVVLPGADHAAHLEDTHDAWVAAVVGFMQRLGTRR